ncbi:MAG: hypothetical protein ABJQ86_03060, partial [Cyclobacteriaceae bacterium]
MRTCETALVNADICYATVVKGAIVDIIRCDGGCPGWVKRYGEVLCDGCWSRVVNYCYRSYRGALIAVG